MLNSGPMRVLCGAFLGTLTGMIYYDPRINYLMEIWTNEYFPGRNFDDFVVDRELVLKFAATVLGLIVLAACVNQYVNYKYNFLAFSFVLRSILKFVTTNSKFSRQISSRRLFTMALELWLMSICLQFPHVLWASQSLKGFVIDQIYDLLILIVVSFAVGFNRFNEPKKFHFEMETKSD